MPARPYADLPTEQLLADLVLDRLPSPADVKEAVERDWLRPSEGGRKELSGIEWAMHWDHPLDVPSLMHIEPSHPTTSIRFQARGLDGEIASYSEEHTVRATARAPTATSSSSLTRQPANVSSFVRGNSSYFPFKPGGLDGAIAEDAEDVVGAAEGLEKAFERGTGGIRTVPPGFTRGLDFSELEGEEEEMQEEEEVKVEPVYRPMSQITSNPARNMTNGDRAKEPSAPRPKLDSTIDDLLPSHKLQTTVQSSTARPRRRPVIAKRDWAHVVDVNRPLLNFHELVPQMAKEYPFELDTFQKEAVYHIEVGESVFVAAHTSAGKTVVAEYAIALAAKHMTRAIYTSPIKALSNQKFRDFQGVFGTSGVGILTGDVQINPEASCLIMTTEILRSMLYKGADLIRDVEWVIFDEVHYVNDQERGVVWEEVIIMLPDHVGIILLSATVPNTKEFADWVGRTKKKDIYVISTPKRPVPLEHFLYAGKELHKIVDSKGQFLSTGWSDAKDSMRRKQEKEREAAGVPPPTRGGGRGGPGGAARGANRGGQPRGRGAPASKIAPVRASYKTSQARDATLWIHLIGLLRKKELLPVVVFTFSKRRCEENAASMPNTDLCSASEKSEVHIAIEKSLTRLKGSDKTLPQIANMRQLLSRGIGVHHGGLLPIVKEIVELLFARGLVKVLFATETFAMGVNMPAKCVVFSGIRKHDGRSFRDLLPGEYTQMAGRAGRRGLDTTGTVIIVANDSEPPDTTTLLTMLLGQPTKLNSQFRLTYSMILNLLRVEALRVEEMIKRSFSENAAQRLLPEHQKKVQEGELELKGLRKLDDGPRTRDLREFYEVSLQLVELNTKVIDGVLGHPAAARMISSGRVVILSDGHFRNSPAVIVKSAPLGVLPTGLMDDRKRFFVLAFVSQEIKSGKRDVAPELIPPRWPPTMSTIDPSLLTYELAIVPSTSVALVTRFVIKVDADSIADRLRKSHMEQALADFVALMPDLAAPPESLEADWSKVRGLEFREAYHSRTKMLQSLHGLQPPDDKLTADVYEAVHAERILLDKISVLKMALSDQNLELLPDYEQRIAVLKELQYIDAESTVLLKGRVACEINSASELILTELILENTFASYEPEEVVALLSSFIFQEKTETVPLLTPKLEEGKEVIEAIAERVRLVQAKHRADIADDGFQVGLKFGLVEVVYEWAKGMPFAEITSLTDVQEGTIVRAITRLDETCREVRDAARIVGNADLFKKMEECQSKIRRDIVFCASLYF